MYHFFTGGQAILKRGLTQAMIPTLFPPLFSLHSTHCVSNCCHPVIFTWTLMNFAVKCAFSSIRAWVPPAEIQEGPDYFQTIPCSLYPWSLGLRAGKCKMWGSLGREKLLSKVGPDPFPATHLISVPCSAPFYFSSPVPHTFRCQEENPILKGDRWPKLL